MKPARSIQIICYSLNTYMNQTFFCYIVWYSLAYTNLFITSVKIAYCVITIVSTYSWFSLFIQYRSFDEDIIHSIQLIIRLCVDTYILTSTSINIWTKHFYLCFKFCDIKNICHMFKNFRKIQYMTKNKDKFYKTGSMFSTFRVTEGEQSRCDSGMPKWYL